MTQPRRNAPGPFTATINDVAARAGVSKRTVSRVMNGERNVHERTRDRVMSVVATLGYRPDPIARRLAMGKARVIALFHSSHSTLDGTTVRSVVLTAARAAHQVLVCSIDDRAPEAAHELAELTRELSIAGALLWPPMSDTMVFGRVFQEEHVPYVSIGSATIEGRLAVRTDDAEASRRMTQYLAALGHRRIAFVSAPPGHCASLRRLQGFLEGMNASRLRVDDELILRGEETFAFGGQCAHELLLRNGAERPTAIFAGSDVVAAGALAAAHELRIAVPTRLSVAGFGDQPIATQVWPALTTVRQPLRALAERATASLLDRLCGASLQQEGSDEPPASEIVVRCSTGRHDAIAG